MKGNRTVLVFKYCYQASGIKIMIRVLGEWMLILRSIVILMMKVMKAVKPKQKVIMNVANLNLTKK